MPPIPAFKNPREASRPKINRLVLKFSEALANLKNAVGRSVQCAAYPRGKRCQKDVNFEDLDLQFLLAQLSITNNESVMQLTALMLCQTHWNKTVFSTAMFLDFISEFEWKQNRQEYENIVVDLESAKIMVEEEEYSFSEPLDPSENVNTGEQSKTHAISSSNRGSCFVNFGNIQIPASPTDSEHLSGTIPTNSSTQSTILEASSSEETNKESKGRVNGPGTGDEPASKIGGALSVVSLHSYASLELGVARLEIMFQKSVKCISMAQSGWRCQEIIQNERLLEARRLLSSLNDSVDGLKDLSKLMLCPGHSIGDLPRLYSEAWSAFVAKRLPTREAIAKFDAGHRRHIQFFGDKSTQQTGSEKFEFDFNFRCTQPGIPFAEHSNLESEPSIPYSKMSQGQRIDVDGRKQHEISHIASEHISQPTSEATKLANSSSHQSEGSTATISPIFRVPATPSSPSPLPQVSTPVANRIEILRGLSNTPNRDTESVAESDTTDSLENRDAPFKSKKKIKIPFPSSTSPRRSIIVKLPPITSNVSNEISDLSSALSRSKISDEASSPYHSSSSTPADVQDAATPEETDDTQTPQPRQKSPSPTPQRDTRPPLLKASQSAIHDNIIHEMSLPISRGGFVYVLKSASRHLIKIGRTTNIDRRIQEIKARCQLDDLVEVESDSKRILYPERVEKLAHLELRNFRATVTCPHLRYGTTNNNDDDEEVQKEHREWFDVPEEVAVQSVKRWRRFVEVAYTPAAMLKESWQLKVCLLPAASDEEKECLKSGLGEGGELHMANHHRLRNERYWKWMEEA